VDEPLEHGGRSAATAGGDLSQRPKRCAPAQGPEARYADTAQIARPAKRDATSVSGNSPTAGLILEVPFLRFLAQLVQVVEERIAAGVIDARPPSGHLVNLGGPLSTGEALLADDVVIVADQAVVKRGGRRSRRLR